MRGLLFIGSVRRALFAPFPCKWNGLVRDWTAWPEMHAPWLIRGEP